MKCEICSKEFNSICTLSTHISSHNSVISKEEYYRKYINTDIHTGKCKLCGKPTKFHNMNKGYSIFCSAACVSRDPELIKRVKESKDSKYGIKDENGIIKQSYKGSGLSAEEYYRKNINTNLNAGKCKICGNPTRFVSASKGYSTFCSSACISKDPDITKKIEETNFKKYGTKNPLSNKEVQERVKETNKERFGVEYPSQRSYHNSMCVETRIKNSGSVYNSYQERNKKSEETNMNKHGVRNVFQTNDVKAKIKEYQKIEFFKKITSSERLKNRVIPMFKQDEYLGVTDGRKYKWKCTKCENIFEDHLDDGRVPRCYICNPRQQVYSSKYEEELLQFVQFLGIQKIIQRDRSVLSGLELDLYLPDENFAIEFNGLYWHSELNGKDSNYHLNKTLKCNEHGIQLIHIYEDEWINKQEIVKSIISHKLGRSSNTIYARNCMCSIVSSTDVVNNFLDTNHIQGKIYSDISIGLYYNGDLVSLLCLSAPRFSENHGYEITRFCSKLGYNIPGGFSKLFKEALRIIKDDHIITYADMRYSSGIVYNSNGFKFIRSSNPSYYYINMDSYSNRENRMKYMKHKLKDKFTEFDEGLTEWENMQLNGYDRIWDCGNSVFEYRG